MAQQQGSDKPGQLRVKQVRGWAACSKKQLAVLQGLGLGRKDRSVDREDTAAIRGMISKVSHLVEVTKLGDTEGAA